MTEAWFRNPTYYLRELIEVGPRAMNMIWDRGVIHKNRIDPQKYVELNVPTFMDYRIILVGPQGAAELGRDSSFAAPKAVYPVFEYGRQKWHELEEMMAIPITDRLATFRPDKNVPDEWPVPGQEHRVVVVRPPNGNTSEGRSFLVDLHNLQAEYPEAILHVHGYTRLRLGFGAGLGAADYEARTVAAKGRVLLPNGREIETANLAEWQMWINMLGSSVGQLDQPRERCIFNIKSVLWASENFERDVYFRTRRVHHRNRDESDMFPSLYPQTVKPTTIAGALDGDEVLCDSCSLAPRCKLFRDGGICAVPSTDISKLASMFKSRDANVVVAALGDLMAVGVERLEEGRAEEEGSGELDPEVTKITNGLFDQGLKLAKVLNPMLGVKVTATLSGAVEGITQGNAGALMAGVIAELEATGMPREDITPELVMAVLQRTARPAIEASSAPVEPGF